MRDINRRKLWFSRGCMAVLKDSARWTCRVAVSHLIIPFVRRRSSVIIVARASSDEIDASTHRRTYNPYSMLGQTIWQRCRIHSSILPPPLILSLSLSLSLLYVTCPTSPTLPNTYDRLCSTCAKNRSVFVWLLPADNQVNVNPGLVYRHFTLGSWISRGKAVETRAASLLASFDRSWFKFDVVPDSWRISSEFSMFERDGFHRWSRTGSTKSSLSLRNHSRRDFQVSLDDFWRFWFVDFVVNLRVGRSLWHRVWCIGYFKRWRVKSDG